MLKDKVDEICRNAKNAFLEIANIDEFKINAVLSTIKEYIKSNRESIKRANLIDFDNARENNLKSSLLDRLLLNDKRIDGMIESIDVLISLKSPVGETIEGYRLENGLDIEKTRVPIGVIGIIYESRPNVTIDAAALCLKSSNCSVLRGGKEALNTNKLLVSMIKKALKDNGLNENCVGFIDDTDRKGVAYLSSADKYVDAVIPRGGEGLIKFVSENATVPVIKHDKGLCHTYIDYNADIESALNIAYNAKVQRPGVCNAMETLLVHKDIAQEFLPKFYELMKGASVELRGCEKTCEILQDQDIKKATEKDWETEYLDLILSIKIVESIDEAINHINLYGSSHSEAIVTENYQNAEDFLNRVDASCVYVNASTRFTDGGVFGMGAEIGISTNKLHARGPVGLKELTIYKYKIRGKGQIRG